MNKYLLNFINLNKNEILVGDYNNSFKKEEFIKLINKFYKSLKYYQDSNKSFGVGIYLSRDINYLAAIFSILLSGNYFIPLNQAWPKKHLKKIIDYSKPKLIITNKNIFYKRKSLKALTLKEIIAVKTKKEKLLISNSKISETKLAYVIYTSGSSGEQKGVMISRKNFSSYLNWVIKYFKKKIKVKSLLITGEMTFDIVMADLANALAFRSTIYLTPQTNNLVKALQMLHEKKIDTIYGVPTTLKNLYLFSKLRKKKELKSLKNIFCGGDIFTSQLLKLIRSQSYNSKIFNMYGPTELSMNCLCQDLTSYKPKTSSEKIPNGQKFKHLNYKLFDQNKNSFNNYFGELVVSGDQCMQGYLGDKKKTKNAFITYNNIKYYRTGDLFKKNKNTYFYEGRFDKQVKIKGYRVDLNTIDIFFSKLKFIKESKTILLELKNNIKKIITHVVLYDNLKKINFKKLIFFKLKKNLPSYIHPNEIIFLKKIPYNESGKFDELKLKKQYKV